MAKAFKLLDTLLDSRIPALEGGEIAVICVELIATDVRQLFHLYHEKLRWIVREEQVGDIFEGWAPAEVKALLAQLISYYNNNYEAVQSFLVDASELLQLYHIRFPSTLQIPNKFESAYSSDGSLPLDDTGNVGTGHKIDNIGRSKKSKMIRRLGANQAVKSRKVDLHADLEPTVVDIEDYDGDDFYDDDNDDVSNNSEVIGETY